jgi:hypothetical protein
MHNDRRSARRVVVAGLRVTHAIPGGIKLETLAVNVSPRGAFVYTELPPAPGAFVSLAFSLAEGTGWCARARVAWVRRGHSAGPPGMGVELVGLDPAAELAIERLLEGLLAQSRQRARRIPGFRACGGWLAEG